jgi:aminoglycoside phosphotransferase (APT) family kinase protein
MSNIIVAPRVRDLDVLAGQLAGWLAQRLPNAAGVSIASLAYPFGAGRSHETILFDASWREDGREVTKGLVVRIKPTGECVFPDNLFDEQYQLMRLIGEKGWVPVAKTLWFEEDPSLLGAPFFVMEKVKGRVAVSIPPFAQGGWVAEATPAQRAKLWENGVRTLATIQTIPLEGLEFLEGPPGARSGLPQEWDKYSRYVAWVNEKGEWPVLAAALEVLASRMPKNPPAGLVWGDARLGNLMINEDFDVVAVMDWEQPSLGGALHDLAWWVTIMEFMQRPGPREPMLTGMGSREDTIALWKEVCGKPTDDLPWFEDFMQLKIGCMSIRTSLMEGRPLPDHAELIRRLDLKI